VYFWVVGSRVMHTQQSGLDPQFSGRLVVFQRIMGSVQYSCASRCVITDEIDRMDR